MPELQPPLIAAILVMLAAAGLLAYWLIHTTEGAYLGQWAVRWLYDRGASTYDGVKDYDRQDEIAFLAVPLLSRLEEIGAADGEVLDLATGTARLPIALFDVPFFTGTMVGVDISKRMLAEARKKTEDQDYGDRLTLQQGPAAPLPFEDARFDAVCMLEALEFLPNPDEALDELYRVLKPHGWLMTTNRVGWEARLMPGRTQSKQDFEKRLLGHGFVEVETKPWQSYYDLIWARRRGE
jgi:ubiquinone/menaquinone biosynthesis C-methylase UbiE